MSYTIIANIDGYNILQDDTTLEQLVQYPSGETTTAIYMPHQDSPYTLLRDLCIKRIIVLIASILSTNSIDVTELLTLANSFTSIPAS